MGDWSIRGDTQQPTRQPHADNILIGGLDLFWNKSKIRLYSLARITCVSESFRTYLYGWVSKFRKRGVTPK